MNESETMYKAGVIYGAEARRINRQGALFHFSMYYEFFNDDVEFINSLIQLYQLTEEEVQNITALCADS